MRTLLGLVVWGVGITTLGLLAQSDHAKRIEAAIAKEAIASAPNTVHTIKTKVSGRDILVSSMADSETERDIQDSLTAMGEGRTVLTIAHRLSTIADADQIVVLENGVIAEHGTHDELLATEGRYASMWHRQQSEEEEEVAA